MSSYAEVNLVKVNKSERIMYLLDGETVVQQYRIALGNEPKGHKEREGDGRTPEGRYTLEFVMGKGESCYYKSMHISYPNEKDKKNAADKGFSPGGDIKVHGQKNKLGWGSFIWQNFDWTTGCIAIKNSEMDEFLSLVKVGTPIQINP